MTVTDLAERLPVPSWVGRAVDRGFVALARRRAESLEQLNPAAAQRATLERLVRRAASTAFGQAHDFARIRTVADYQQRVPLRDYEAFWQEYWRPAFPGLCNVTWPGRVPYLALSSGTTSGATKYIPVSAAMLRSNRRAALTSLAWYRAAHPEAALFTGRLFFLGGSTALEPPSPAPAAPRAGDLSGIALCEVSGLLRPFVYPSLATALAADWDAKLDRLVEESARVPVTLLSGVPSWLLALFERLLAATGRSRIVDVWPQLRVVVHGGTRFDPYRGLFRRLVGGGVHFLETYPASEGFVAAEDPRHGLLRLIPDHGIFFEFVPVAELASPRPTRHTVADVVPGVSYAVVLTTCAGLWSYVLGDTVCFESREPPLLRFTGRTKQYLSAFGEHLTGDDVERALARAAAATGAEAADFHAGPLFPDADGPVGRHCYLVEFVRPPGDLQAFARVLDGELCRLNDDYRAHRAGDLTLRAPEVRVVPRGGFTAWMRSRGQLGGQHKVPRLDNTGRLLQQLLAWWAPSPQAAAAEPSEVLAAAGGQLT